METIMTQAIRLMQSPAFLGSHELSRVSEQYVTRYDIKGLTSKGLGHVITWIEIFNSQSRPDCSKYGAPGYSDLSSSITVGTWGASETLDSLILDWDRVPSLKPYPVKIDTHIWIPSPQKGYVTEAGNYRDHRLAGIFHPKLRRKLYKVIKEILENPPEF